MTVQVSFACGISRDDVASVVERGLAGHGYRVIQRLRHVPGGSWGELDTALAQAPGASSVTWFHPDAANGQDAVSVLAHRQSGSGSMDMGLPRALSAIGGGFAAAVDSRRFSDQYRLNVYYAGGLIEAIDCSFDAGTLPAGTLLRGGPCDDESIYAAFERLYGEVTGGLPHELRAGPETETESWLIRPAGGPGTRSPADETVSRIAIAGVEEQIFQVAAASLPAAERDGWQWLGARTPVAQIPYVLLRSSGMLDQTLVGRLASKCEASTAALQWQAADPRGTALASFTWLAAEPDGTGSRGEDRGAVAFAERWAALTVTMGESPGILRWPESTPGNWLRQT